MRSQLLGAGSRARVGDRELDPAVRRGVAPTVIRPSGVGVGDGVADQVPEHLREAVGVGLEHAPRGALDPVVALRRAAGRSRRRSCEEVVQVDRAVLDAEPPDSRAARVSMSSTSRFMRSISRRSFVGRLAQRSRFVLLAGEQLDLAPQHGERGSQLVRGVGDELALAAERALQPVEHVVERIGQHAHLVGAVDRPRSAASGRRRRPPRRIRAIRRSGRVISVATQMRDRDRDEQRDRPDDRNVLRSPDCASLHGLQRLGHAECAEPPPAGRDRPAVARATAPVSSVDTVAKPAGRVEQAADVALSSPSPSPRSARPSSRSTSCSTTSRWFVTSGAAATSITKMRDSGW